MRIHDTIRYIAVAATVATAALSTSPEARGCTSAIISAGASASGRPMLWKHRDTSDIDNKIEYVAGRDGTLSYVALFNARDRDLQEAWMGMNEAGFAVMNTASYNIKDDKVPQKQMDREGYVMTLALRTCRTVDDFARLLDELPRPMGVEANFGVLDAGGDGAYFETNNHSYVRYDLKDAPGGVMIRTNYSHSGRRGEGYGYVREANAEHLLRPHVARHDITPELLTETVSRSFYHDLRGRDALEDGDEWVVDQDFIPRYKSTATVVVEGCRPGATDTGDRNKIVEEYIMWTGLGYPPCAEIVPVWCHRDGVGNELRGISEKGTSPLCDKVKMRRDEVFSMSRGDRSKYFRPDKLRNRYGSGYIQTLVPRNLDTYRVIKRKRDRGEIKFD